MKPNSVGRVMPPRPERGLRGEIEALAEEGTVTSDSATRPLVSLSEIRLLKSCLARQLQFPEDFLARYKCPFQVVATDAEMARWLQERSKSLPSGAVRAADHELRGLFAALRARLSP